MNSYMQQQQVLARVAEATARGDMLTHRRNAVVAKITPAMMLNLRDMRFEPLMNEANRLDVEIERANRDADTWQHVYHGLLANEARVA